MNLLQYTFPGQVLLGAAVALGLVANAHAAPAPSRWATLEAIHQLENPTNRTTPGTFGELGAYQFRESTWRMHTTTPFALANDRKTSDLVAVKHYEFLRQRLLQAGLPASVYNIALGWNGGIEAVVQGRSPAVAHDYAERASNIAYEISARVIAMR